MVILWVWVFLVSEVPLYYPCVCAHGYYPWIEGVSKPGVDPAPNTLDLSVLSSCAWG